VVRRTRRLSRSGALLLAGLGLLLAVLLDAGCASAPAGNATDRAFVAQMVPHHQLGVALLDEGARRVQDVRLRRLVFAMSAYHHHELDALTEQLDAWSASQAAVFPGQVDAARLDGLSGRDYDVAWLAAMIEHHEGAVTLAEDHIAAGELAWLRDLAGRTLTVQRRDLDAMGALADEFCVIWGATVRAGRGDGGQADDVVAGAPPHRRRCGSSFRPV
jgi:uncharacterized protein (DUF305 family)